MPLETWRDDYTAAADWVVTLMGRVRPEQLGLPTPCPEFDVRMLMGHLIGTARRGLGTARGVPTDHVPHVVDDVPDHALASAYSEAVHDVRVAWSSLAPETMLRAPWGPCPASEAARGFTVETLVHAWDLARATAQPSAGPEAVAQRCLDSPGDLVPVRLRGVMYDDAVTGIVSGSATEQLARRLGRSGADEL